MGWAEVLVNHCSVELWWEGVLHSHTRVTMVTLVVIVTMVTVVTPEVVGNLKRDALWRNC